MKKDFPTLLIKAKEDVYTHFRGSMLSQFFGQGYDFAELREYESTDDIRHISWINSAKLGEPYIKKMYEERSLNIAICTLLDGRMLQGEKQELVSYLLAILSYSTLLGENRLQNLIVDVDGLQIFQNIKREEGLDESILNVYERSLLGKTLDYPQIETLLLPRLEEKSLLFILGDFLEEIDFSILAKKHELIFIVIRDEEEDEPSFSFDEQLINPLDNKASSQVLSKRAVAYYCEKRKRHDEKLWAYCHQHQIKIVKIYNKEESLKRLEELFYS